MLSPLNLLMTLRLASLIPWLLDAESDRWLSYL
jgi:hypothetical protein